MLSVATSGWYAGATAVHHITATSAVRGFKFTVPSKVSDIVWKIFTIGLTQVPNEDSATNYQGITWRFYFDSTGRFRTYHGTHNKGLLGVINPGDTMEGRGIIVLDFHCVAEAAWHSGEAEE